MVKLQNEPEMSFIQLQKPCMKNAKSNSIS